MNVFELVDRALVNKDYGDERASAMDVLELGLREGNLVDTAKAIAALRGLKTEEVIEWFTTVQTLRVRGIEELLERMREWRRCGIQELLERMREWRR